MIHAILVITTFLALSVQVGTDIKMKLYLHPHPHPNPHPHSGHLLCAIPYTKTANYHSLSHVPCTLTTRYLWSNSFWRSYILMIFCIKQPLDVFCLCMIITVIKMHFLGVMRGGYVTITYAVLLTSVLFSAGDILWINPNVSLAVMLPMEALPEWPVPSTYSHPYLSPITPGICACSDTHTAIIAIMFLFLLCSPSSGVFFKTGVCLLPFHEAQKSSVRSDWMPMR